MFDFITTIIVFILGLGLLITFHEFGHFWVARRFGVKTLCFSVGFGKALVSRTAKDGTEYRIGAIPLGGYVKMLGERSDEVAPNERHRAFNQKSVWARIAIVFAGPAFNFILAFFAYLLVSMIGIKGLVPFVGEIQPGSIADKAGLTAPLEIVAIEDKPTPTWRQVANQIIPKIGDKDSLKISTQSPNEPVQTHLLSLKDWEVDLKNPDLLGSLGLIPAQPSYPTIVDSLIPGGVAEQSGLQVGDEIVAIAGMPIQRTDIFVSEIERRPNIKTEIEVLRGENKEPTTLFIKPAAKVLPDNRLSGYIGVMLKPGVFPSDWIRTQKYSFLESFKPAYEQTVYYTKVSFKLIGKMLMGKLSPEALSGPISIAQGAGASFKMGFQYYIGFLALISISVGVINLLPIPLLDGGHLFFYFVEVLIRRPVPPFIKERAEVLGVLLIAGLIIISFYNDLMRLF